MRKPILMMLLAVVSSSAAAGWGVVGKNDGGTAYADPATIRKAGNIVTMWTLLDFKTANVEAESGNRYMSAKSQNEYDCKEKRTRRLVVSYHSGNMGDGRAVHSNSESGKWVPVPPDSGFELLWKSACGKR